MAALPIQAVKLSGLGAVYSAASAGGDACRPGDRTFLHLKNAAVAPTTVTIAVPGTEYGVARADVPVVIPASSERFVGPLPRDLADPNTGLVALTYSAVLTLTVAALTI
jgi:hypothetical protein